jgi:hypothetical protein
VLYKRDAAEEHVVALIFRASATATVESWAEPYANECMVVAADPRRPS